MEVRFELLEFDWSWSTKTVTVHICDHDVIEVGPMEHYEIDDCMVEFRNDFNEFIADSFAGWIKAKGKAYS